MKSSILLALTLLLGACSTAHLIQTDKTNELKITMKDKVIAEGKGDPFYKHTVNLTNLNIEQTVYKMKDGSILTYEDARAATSNQFTHSMARSVTIIFPTYNATLISIKDNLHFFKLIAKDKSETEYLILENMNKKRVKMVYGLDKNLFYSIYGILIESKESIISNSNKSVNESLDNPESYIKSRWNHKNIILDLIVSKVGTSKIRI